MSGLGARFDNRALQAFELPAAELVAPTVSDWPALRAWCLAAPNVRLAVAVPAPDVGPDAAACARALALELDGSHALQACRSPAARWRLRLAVKWQDLLGSAGTEARAVVLPATRIWDSGRVRGDLVALARFTPRRPSFIVVDQWPADEVWAALAALQARAATWRHPVRVLCQLAKTAPEGAVLLPR